jgi:hypothetical protein
MIKGATLEMPSFGSIRPSLVLSRRPLLGHRIELARFRTVDLLRRTCCKMLKICLYAKLLL